MARQIGIKIFQTKNDIGQAVFPIRCQQPSYDASVGDDFDHETTRALQRPDINPLPCGQIAKAPRSEGGAAMECNHYFENSCLPVICLSTYAPKLLYFVLHARGPQAGPKIRRISLPG